MQLLNHRLLVNLMQQLFNCKATHAFLLSHMCMCMHTFMLAYSLNCCSRITVLKLLTQPHVLVAPLCISHPLTFWHIFSTKFFDLYMNKYGIYKKYVVYGILYCIYHQ